MSSRQLMVSYVQERDGDQWWMVSTIDRLSSTYEPVLYSETMVWLWNPTTRERGEMVWQAEGIAGSITKHVEMAAALFCKGADVYQDSEVQP